MCEHWEMKTIWLSRNWLSLEHILLHRMELCKFLTFCVQIGALLQRDVLWISDW